jgi:flavodoxin/ferredoxin
MQVTLVYFSQTGNTRQAAYAMASGFHDLGHSVRTIPLKKATPEDAAATDLLGVGSPCFTGQAPTPVKDFLRALPRLEKRPAFVFATSGGAPGKVLWDLTRPLRHKGADVVGGTLVRGECFHPAPCFFGRYPGRPNADDLARARRFAVELAEHVAAEREGPVAGGRRDALKRGWGLYDFEGTFVLDPLVRLLLPKPKLNRMKCDKCQWCAYECPSDNIAMDPYPSIGGRCIRCYRCLTGCRQRAFRAGWLLGNLVLLSLHSTLFERWFGDLDCDEAIYRDADKPTSNWSFNMLVAAVNGKAAVCLRAAAARALGEIGHERAAQVLVRALNDRRGDDSARVREAAAHALGRTARGRVTGALLRALHDKDKYVRLAAAGSLGRVASGPATKGLILALDDEHWQVRQTAADALGSIGTSEVVLPLLLALDDENAAVRRSARAALGGIIECDAPDGGGTQAAHWRDRMLAGESTRGGMPH